MPRSSMPDSAAPTLTVSRTESGVVVRAAGRWNVQGLAMGNGGKAARRQIDELARALAGHAASGAVGWGSTWQLIPGRQSLALGQNGHEGAPSRRAPRSGTKQSTSVQTQLPWLR